MAIRPNGRSGTGRDTHGHEHAPLAFRRRATEVLLQPLAQRVAARTDAELLHQHVAASRLHAEHDATRVVVQALRVTARELALDPPDTTSDEAGPPLRDEDYLILSTIHSAKGQEWRSVFVLNCVDGCIPSDLATGSSEEIEEERRLLYVAMTRAKDELALVVPHRFYVHGQPRNGDRSVYASRTRFIPPPLLKHFDRQTWPEAGASPGRATAAVRPQDLLPGSPCG